MNRGAEAVPGSTGRAGEQPAGPNDDGACRAIAEDIQRQRPDWLVLWGTYSKRFVAFPKFTVRQRAIVIAHYPDALLARLDEAERQLRVRPEPGENQR